MYMDDDEKRRLLKEIIELEKRIIELEKRVDKLLDILS
jgi:hypothetical protein